MVPSLLLALPYGSTFGPAKLASGITRVRILFGLGQSEIDGNSAVNALTTSALAPGRALMLAEGARLWRPGSSGLGWTVMLPDSSFPLVDLKEANAGSSAGETPMSGLVSKLIAAAPATDAFLVINNAVSGSAYETFKRGTVPYYTSIKAVRSAITQIKLANPGVKVEVMGAFLGHGQQDSKVGVTQAQYLAKLLEWQQLYTYFAQDVCEHLGEVPFYIKLANDWSRVGGSGNTGPYRAMWQAAVDYPGRFYVVEPNYQLPKVEDDTHYTNVGSRRAGEYGGVAIARIEAAIAAEAAVKPCLSIKSATRSGAVITAILDAPVEPVVEDTGGLFNSAANKGIYYSQTGGTARTISTVAVSQVSGVSRLTVTLSGDPGAPSAEEIGAVFSQAVPNAHTIFRDSATATGVDGAVLRNWMVPCYRAVTT
jgi:hypothetical protein